MGHEATGEVVAVGEGVRGLAVGDRVATNTIAACGRCRPCLAGERSLCENRLIMGMNAPGAYAEYVVWPEDSLPRLPDGLSYEVGALAEPLAVALHGVNMAGIQPGDDVFIAGGGPIGVLVHVLVRMAGAGRILVSDMHPARLATARALGADIVVDAEHARTSVEVVREATGGSGADVSIEAVGAGATARHTIDATRNAGLVVWLGNSDDRIEIGMQTLVTRNLNVRGSYGMTGPGVRARAGAARGRPAAGRRDHQPLRDAGRGAGAVRAAARRPRDHQVRHPPVGADPPARRLSLRAGRATPSSGAAGRAPSPPPAASCRRPARRTRSARWARSRVRRGPHADLLQPAGQLGLAHDDVVAPVLAGGAQVLAGRRGAHAPVDLHEVQPDPRRPLRARPSRRSRAGSRPMRSRRSARRCSSVPAASSSPAAPTTTPWTRRACSAVTQPSRTPRATTSASRSSGSPKPAPPPV